MEFVDGTNIGTICKVLGVPIELSNTVFVQKLHLEGYSFTNTANERRKEQLELIEQTFKQSQWRYHELHFLHEFSCRYGYILLLSEETNETRIWKSSLVATTANSHPPTMEISFNITKDSQCKTHVLSIFNQFELINDNQRHLLNKIFKHEDKCVKIRGHIFLKKSNLKLPKSDPHIRSVLLEIFPQFTTKINLDNKRDHGNVVDLDEELMLHFFSFVRDVHGYDKPIEREIMLQRFWFPALHTKETLKCTTSRKHMPSLLGRDAHTRISRAMAHSIAKYEVTCIPHSRKVKLKLIPKTIPIFVTNVCFMALIYGCSKLNEFLANKYLKENMDDVILGYFIKGWLVLTTNLAIVVMAVFGCRAFMEMFHSLYEPKEIEL
ncbi:hypothetical protein C9374_001785 [Naegleria lovaniensis]|uniref:Uncharacterized protein n=1 Tax=Naegleria lovaniensis TaxID=51637 RepID=A0AA88GW66_NAELO|nr:uncharacterized protein C9374_001785 [Naegleria lovaniensis]KAG2387453.1 hypothetical protein C9374_001785 [Naegleria lovaniensis]